MQIKRPISRQPIPKTAKLVFKGIIFDIYQWKQKLFDGTYQTFEKSKRQDTVNVIPITTDGKIVLSKQEQPGSEPFIGAFGGGIEDKENPLNAAKRELLEETGFKAKEFIIWNATQFIDKIDWAIYTFIAKDCSVSQEQQTDAGEKIKLIYLTFDEFMDVITQPNYRDSEVALKIFQLSNNPKKLADLRKLFSI